MPLSGCIQVIQVAGTQVGEYMPASKLGSSVGSSGGIPPTDRDPHLAGGERDQKTWGDWTGNSFWVGPKVRCAPKLDGLSVYQYLSIVNNMFE